MPTKSDFLYMVKQYRKKYRITQEEMAKALGLCRSTYSKKENAIIECSYDDCLLIFLYINKKANDAGDEYIAFEDFFMPNSVSAAQQ